MLQYEITRDRSFCGKFCELRVSFIKFCEPQNLMKLTHNSQNYGKLTVNSAVDSQADKFSCSKYPI